jgi:hypothetical protein
MNAILSKFDSMSLRSILLLWSAWIAMNATGTHLPDWFVISATLGVCFKEGLGKLTPQSPPKA